MTADPALRFLADLVEAEGGAAEDRGESAILLLDSGLAERLRIPEELVVTGDPEVAADEGALLVSPGQPVVAEAADLVVARGDAGWRHLGWPASPPPPRERLQEAAREEVVVDHGRVDLEGQPAPCFVPVVRVAAVLEHRVTVEERYEEAAEVVVDGRNGAPLDPRLAAELASLPERPGPGPGHPRAEPRLVPALEAAHRLLEARAGERQATLVRESRTALERERGRVDGYYQAALDTIEARRAGASPERDRLLTAQAEATRAEWARRLQETEEKFAGSAGVRPFLLHLLDVPGLAVPVTVRRGPRRFDLRLDWLLPFNRFAQPACPHCGATEPLVAGRERLGCRSCLARPAVPEPPAPPTPPVRPARPARPAQKPGGEEPESEEPEPARAEVEVAAAPSALQERRLEKLWRSVAETFWSSVASGERCRSVAARSPLEALYRCFGAAGPLLVVGLPARAYLMSLRSTPPEGDVDGVLTTSGVLDASEGATPFQLRWRLVGKAASFVEVVPHRAVPARAAALPVPGRLGPVEERLWHHEAMGTAGDVALAIRCLALYWRIQGHRRLGGLGVPAVAAGVATVARRSSGRRGGLEAVARAHGVAAAEVRAARDAIELVLGSAITALW